ncbi:MAG TPA: peptidase M28, partial [Dyadobacter sp.]|nr:peptidase M28 [Dyadobacter sp.]
MKFFLSALFFAIPSVCLSQSIQPSPANITKHISYLASDKMKGRGTGSKENDEAARYVAKQFKKYNLTPKGSEGYYQPFTAKVRRVVVPDSLRKTKNVIGFLDNGAPY